MNPFNAFRASVVAAAVIAVMTIVYTPAATCTFSQDWQDLLAWSGDGHIFSDREEFAPRTDIAISVLLVVFLIVAVGNQIALFFYWKPSRLIYLCLTIIGYLTVPFSGLTVSPPLETLGYELTNFFSGVTLALAYFSPVAERFK